MAPRNTCGAPDYGAPRFSEISRSSTALECEGYARARLIAFGTLLVTRNITFIALG